jgi:hypothetical protein
MRVHDAISLGSTLLASAAEPLRGLFPQHGGQHAEARGRDQSPLGRVLFDTFCANVQSRQYRREGRRGGAALGGSAPEAPTRLGETIAAFPAPATPSGRAFPARSESFAMTDGSPSKVSAGEKRRGQPMYKCLPKTLGLFIEDGSSSPWKGPSQ